MEIIIRKLDSSDWPAAKEIYMQGIETKNATFEKSAPSWEEWDSGKVKSCRLAAVINNEVIGWGGLSLRSKREVYKGVNEVSVYVSPNHSGKGIGRKLLEALIAESESCGIWTLTAAIFPENTASIRLHASCGFREIGYMEKVGIMDGIWRDTILFERRSKVAGV